MVSMPVSASREHSRANLHMTPEEAVEQVRLVRQLCDSQPADRPVRLEVGISTAFGCSLQGFVPEDWVYGPGCHGCGRQELESVGSSDTAGYANPAQVKRMFTQLKHELASRQGRYAGHFHNTYGQGLANVLAALEVGVRTFDSSQGGLGGCPATLPERLGTWSRKIWCFCSKSMATQNRHQTSTALIEARGDHNRSSAGRRTLWPCAQRRPTQSLHLRCKCLGSGS